MIFQKEIALKDGTPCLLRSGQEDKEQKLTFK